jgi:hypothetical protein
MVAASDALALRAEIGEAVKHAAGGDLIDALEFAFVENKLRALPSGVDVIRRRPSSIVSHEHDLSRC